MREEEIVLRELEEVVGVFNGISKNKTFTQVKIGDRAVVLENGAKSTENVVEQLGDIKAGANIGILHIGGDFRVRLSNSEKEGSANQN